MPVKQLAPTEYRAKRNSSSFGSWNNSLHYGIQTLKTGMKQSKVNYKCKKPNSGKRSSKQMKKIKTNKNIKRSNTCWRLINLVLYQRRCICVAGYHLGCVADLIYPQLVINVAKQCPYPCSGQKTNSMHQRLCVSNSHSTPLANANGFFLTCQSWLVQAFIIDWVRKSSILCYSQHIVYIPKIMPIIKLVFV